TREPPPAAGLPSVARLHEAVTTMMKMTSFRPTLETLETRDTPTAGFGLQGTTLVINGSDTADTATGTPNEHNKNTPFDDTIQVVFHDQGYNVVRVQTIPVWTQGFLGVPIPNVTRIEFYGGKGADTFTNNSYLPCHAEGGDDGDSLFGGSGNDELI